MDVVKLPAIATETPVTVTVTVTETEIVAPPPSWAVSLVAGWALVAAAAIFFVRAVDYIFYYLHVPCHPYSIVLRCVYLTHAAAEEEADLWAGIFSCATFQAAAALLALLLAPRRRWLRYGVAFVALAVAVSGHCSYVDVVHLVLVADPAFIFYRICCSAFIVFLAIGDIVSFIALLRGRPGRDEQEEVAAAGRGQQLSN